MGNDCSKNGDEGIDLGSSENNILLGNDCSRNDGDGICLCWSNNNTLSGNTFYSNENHGILGYSSKNNTILENDCSGNEVDGIHLGDESWYNIILGNICHNNSKKIVLYDNLAYQNQLYLNIIFDNDEKNAEDHGTGNQWDNGTIGNFWGNYSGEDADGDGIGDEPFNIFGDAGSQDSYPIYNNGPIIPIPLMKLSLIIISPVEGTVFTAGENPSFKLAVMCLDYQAVWYSVNNGDNITLNSSGNMHQGVWDSLPDGEFTITFYVNDSEGHIASKSVILIKDISSTPDPFLIALIALPIIFGVIGGASGLFVLQRYLCKRKRQEERKEMKGKLKPQLEAAKTPMELKYVISQADTYGLREIGDPARERLRPVLREKLESSSTEEQIESILSDAEECHLPEITDAASRKLRAVRTRAIKSTVLDLGTKFPRLQIVEIAERTGADPKLIVETVKEMISKGEIYADYFESSRSVAFNQQANIDEIDSLMDSFRDWEREGKGKRE